jgi:hypothetical protein
MTALSEAYRAAFFHFLATHPEPTDIDRRCPFCRAEPLEPCSWPEENPRPGRRRYHRFRTDRTNRAIAERLDAACRAGDQAEQAAERADRRSGRSRKQ